MKTFRFTDKEANLIGESVLAKIRNNRRAMELITSVAAYDWLQKEICELNEILEILARE